MADIPADVREIAAGSCSDGVDKRGKRAPNGPAGARQGVNDYTGWFAGSDDMRGDWFGYEGPYPPPNDLRMHLYFFRLFSLAVDRPDLPSRLTAGPLFPPTPRPLPAPASVHTPHPLPNAQ